MAEHGPIWYNTNDLVDECNLLLLVINGWSISKTIALLLVLKWHAIKMKNKLEYVTGYYIGSRILFLGSLYNWL